MEGEIGILLLNGQQVGGFLFWTHQDGKYEASSYWRIAKISSGIFEASFYRIIMSALELVNHTTVKAIFPDCLPDKLIRYPIQMEPV